MPDPADSRVASPSSAPDTRRTQADGTTPAPRLDAARRATRAAKRRRAARYLAVAFAGFGGVIYFLYVTAASNSAFFTRNYTNLLYANLGLLGVLGATVVWLGFRLWQRHRRRRFGARLMARLALTLGLVGVLPGALIYTVSVQFLARSLESWFNLRVDTALEAGVRLGQASLDALRNDLINKARDAALELADASPAGRAALVNRLREQTQATDAVLFTATGRVLATAAGGLVLAPDLPGRETLSRLRVTPTISTVEGDDPADAGAQPLRLRVIVPVPASLTGGLVAPADDLYLQIVQNVPTSLADNAQAVTAVYQDYRELALGRDGLRKIYTIALTLTLLLAAFAAMVSALLLANRFARPLQALAEGTRAVAEGDFKPLPEPGTRDEIAALTDSFNRMTAQLGEARAVVEAREAELARANAYLSSLLANISTGVVVFDERLRLMSANPAAETIIGAPLSLRIGSALAVLPVLDRIADAVRDAFASHADSHEPWQSQFEIERDGAADLALLARGSRLVTADGMLLVMVFDDITQILSAQRALAWGEVARRLAHEIKNPLTPIQLSAERLEHKLADKLSPEDAAVLTKGARTIVTQVAALKHMVDEFREYARLPPTTLAPVDLNRVVEDVAALYGGVPARFELAPDLPAILGDAGQLRQVIHNLLQNAQDAVTSRIAESGPIPLPPDGDPAHIVLKTEALQFAASDRVRKLEVRLQVRDRGTGFNPRIAARIFEPYVTNKPRGTGLGLAIVRKIADEHGARIEAGNADDGGAIVTLFFTRLAPAQS
ncbi:sensor histidine kinase [Derxia gummosa]|uniref:histidine kinase n=1 Tax=Derxia gummosa DSM 723 TaxID=1121388 RepID=A0A8B6X8M0_9BURK|nr:ATP-binding protein [Derxia gummosa]